MFPSEDLLLLYDIVEMDKSVFTVRMCQHSEVLEVVEYNVLTITKSIRVLDHYLPSSCSF